MTCALTTLLVCVVAAAAAKALRASGATTHFARAPMPLPHGAAEAPPVEKRHRAAAVGRAHRACAWGCPRQRARVGPTSRPNPNAVTKSSQLLGWAVEGAGSRRRFQWAWARAHIRHCLRACRRTPRVLSIRASDVIRAFVSRAAYCSNSHHGRRPTAHAKTMTLVWLEPTPLRAGACSQRIRPLGHTAMRPCHSISDGARRRSRARAHCLGRHDVAPARARYIGTAPGAAACSARRARTATTRWARSTAAALARASTRTCPRPRAPPAPRPRPRPRPPPVSHPHRRRCAGRGPSAPIAKRVGRGELRAEREGARNARRAQRCALSQLRRGCDGRGRAT
jgi:hypothetical protein